MGADLADGFAVVLAEVGDRLVVGNQAPGQPHHFHVATGLALVAAARLNPVEIAVDVELQQNRGVIRRPPGRHRSHAIKPEFGNIKLVDEDVDEPNRLVLVNPGIPETACSDRDPRPQQIASSNPPAQIHAGNRSIERVFTHPGSFPTVTDCPHTRPETGAERSSQGRMSEAGANADVPSVSPGGQGLAKSLHPHELVLPSGPIIVGPVDPIDSNQ